MATAMRLFRGGVFRAMAAKVPLSISLLKGRKKTNKNNGKETNELGGRYKNLRHDQ